MLKKEARVITGGLSAPSKMPGPAYNLPASQCITGAKLVNVPGSVCHGWSKFGPRIMINKRALEPLKLKQSLAEARRQSRTYKRHN